MPPRNSVRRIGNLAIVERQEIVRVLGECQQIAAAAPILGISRHTLHVRIREHAITLEEWRSDRLPKGPGLRVEFRILRGT